MPPREWKMRIKDILDAISTVQGSVVHDNLHNGIRAVAGNGGSIVVSGNTVNDNASDGYSAGLHLQGSISAGNLLCQVLAVGFGIQLWVCQHFFHISGISINGFPGRNKRIPPGPEKINLK